MRKARLPSPALVIACLALAVALSGVGYAAIKIPANSVGTKQLKSNAVTGAKVKDNSLTGADVNEFSLTGILHEGDAAGGQLGGTFPNPTLLDGSVASEEVEDGSLNGDDINDNSLTGSDINESTLGVLQGHGSSTIVSTTQTGGAQMNPSDIIDVPGAGFIRAMCNIAGPTATFAYRDTSGSQTYVWVDTGVDNPADLRANGNSNSANTTTGTPWDLQTWFIRPVGGSQRYVVQLALSIESLMMTTQCQYYATIQRIDP